MSQKQSKNWSHLPSFSSPSLSIFFLFSLLQPEMKEDINLFKTFPYVPININKCIEFITHVVFFVLPHLISQNQDLAFRIGSGCMEAIFHIYFQYCFPLAWCIDPRKTQHIFLRPWGGVPFKGSSKLPTNQQLAETCIKSSHLEMVSWLMLLELSSPLQQTFWVKNSSKHMHSRPGHFSCVFCAPHQNGWVMALSNSGSSKVSDGMQAVVWTSLSR